MESKMKAPEALIQACDFPIDGDGNKTIDETTLRRLKKEVEEVECTIRRANLEEKFQKIIAEYSSYFPVGDFDSGWVYYKRMDTSGFDCVYMKYTGRFHASDFSKYQKVSIVVYFDREIKVEIKFGNDYSPCPGRDVEFTLYDVTNPSELKARIISGIRETGDCCRDFLSNLESNAAF
jgi:hypothetical protein